MSIGKYIKKALMYAVIVPLPFLPFGCYTKPEIIQPPPVETRYEKIVRRLMKQAKDHKVPLRVPINVYILKTMADESERIAKGVREKDPKVMELVRDLKKIADLHKIPLEALLWKYTNSIRTYEMQKITAAYIKIVGKDAVKAAKDKANDNLADIIDQEK